MIRCAEPNDAPSIESFLQSHAATSMFLRGNLAAHGTNEYKHPHGTTFYIKEEGKRIIAIAGRTNCGYVMSQSPDNDPAFFDDLAQELEGKMIVAMTGAPAQVRAFLAVIGCKDQLFAKRDVQPLYEMDVSKIDLSVFENTTEFRVPDADDANFLEYWFAGYHADTGVPIPKDSNLSALAVNFIEKTDARLLFVDGVPVAMTTMNARVSDTVQVGGVYVPSSERGKGYGGQIVAMHLAELRSNGITKAILFAASAAAARAYEKIGFVQIGSYEIALLNDRYLIGT